MYDFFLVLYFLDFNKPLVIQSIFLFLTVYIIFQLLLKVYSYHSIGDLRDLYQHCCMCHSNPIFFTSRHSYSTDHFKFVRHMAERA